jgi:hypothetical protein
VGTDESTICDTWAPESDTATTVWGLRRISSTESMFWFAKGWANSCDMPESRAKSIMTSTPDTPRSAANSPTVR